MKKMILLGAFSLLFSSILVFADNDGSGKEEGGHGSRELLSRFFGAKPLDVAPVKNKVYQEECGSCHFAYQPGLLPERSWKKLMANLEDHFDENAELDADVQKALTDYLIKNSTDKSDYNRSRRIMNSLGKSDTPLRITEVAYFIRKHDEIPKRMIVDNPKVGSLSQCEACHTHADKGSYNEDDINIPGVGKWEK